MTRSRSVVSRSSALSIFSDWYGRVGAAPARREGSRRGGQERVEPLLDGWGEEYDGPMAALWVVIAVLAFVGVCVAFVWGCHRIIGPDGLGLHDDTFTDASGEVLA